MNYKIYTGDNRLENWMIDKNRVSNFWANVVEMEDRYAYYEARDELSVESITEEVDFADAVFVSSGSNPELSPRRMVGAAMVRTGVAILMVPDPVPFVDELVGAAFIGIGGALLYS